MHYQPINQLYAMRCWTAGIMKLHFVTLFTCAMVAQDVHFGCL